MARNKYQVDKDDVLSKQRDFLVNIKDIKELEDILVTCCGPHNLLTADKKYGRRPFNRELVEKIIQDRQIEDALFGV